MQFKRMRNFFFQGKILTRIIDFAILKSIFSCIDSLLSAKYEGRENFGNMRRKRVEQNNLNSEMIEDFFSNSKKFMSLMMMYRSTIREIKTKLEVLDDEFSIEHRRNPIASIKSRIKSPESIYQKLTKLGYEVTTDNIREHLNDVAGIRVVCPFLEDIYHVADLLASQDDIKLIKVKDYIEHPKENGYRSYHMIVEIPVFFSEGKTLMRAEVQIRTIGMDFWASLEHQLRYKKGLEETELYDQISQRLQETAKMITATDIEMEEIKQMLEKFQKEREKSEKYGRKK